MYGQSTYVVHSSVKHISCSNINVLINWPSKESSITRRHFRNILTSLGWMHRPAGSAEKGILCTRSLLQPNFEISVDLFESYEEDWGCFLLGALKGKALDSYTLIHTQWYGQWYRHSDNDSMIKTQWFRLNYSDSMISLCLYHSMIQIQKQWFRLNDTDTMMQTKWHNHNDTDNTALQTTQWNRHNDTDTVTQSQWYRQHSDTDTVIQTQWYRHKYTDTMLQAQCYRSRESVWLTWRKLCCQTLVFVHVQMCNMTSREKHEKWTEMLQSFYE